MQVYTLVWLESNQIVFLIIELTHPDNVVRKPNCSAFKQQRQLSRAIGSLVTPASEGDEIKVEGKTTECAETISVIQSNV